MTNGLKFPFYAKAALIAVGLYALFSILSTLQDILVPLIFSILAAILLSPLVTFLEERRINRLLAIIITVITFFAVVVLVAILISQQIIRFAHELPKLTENFNQLINDGAGWIASKSGIGRDEIVRWINDRKSEVIDGLGSDMGRKLITTGSAVVFVIVIPIYIFMILHYQPLLLNFVHRLFSPDNQADVNEVINDTKSIIQSYLIGIIFQGMIIAVLYVSVLLLLGIDYAILLGLIGAFLNFIPYLGAILAATLPMIIALATEQPAYALYVLACYVGIQIIDNNFIVPKVVASRVSVNALVSIIVVIAGGTLWGIAGMFLAIPLTAILKVVFDHMRETRPLGYLMGDSIPFISLSNSKSDQPEGKKRRRRTKPSSRPLQ